jgi:hypothetical protein
MSKHNEPLYIEAIPHEGACDNISVAIFRGEEVVAKIDLDPIEAMSLAEELIGHARDQIIKPIDDDEEGGPEVVQ